MKLVTILIFEHDDSFLIYTFDSLNLNIVEKNRDFTKIWVWN